MLGPKSSHVATGFHETWCKASDYHVHSYVTLSLLRKIGGLQALAAPDPSTTFSGSLSFRLGESICREYL
jgi:hypothetical protein